MYKYFCYFADLFYRNELVLNVSLDRLTKINKKYILFQPNETKVVQHIIKSG